MMPIALAVVSAVSVGRLLFVEFVVSLSILICVDEDLGVASLASANGLTEYVYNSVPADEDISATGMYDGAR